ncbi:MAG TPA: YihY/virulence factor BrkB family protein [Candidatus Saccharimonadales bacterium]|nr:YihY/virulence factor BrkB family protein [Candidatus Saccharimonadales bacterium]
MNILQKLMRSLDGFQRNHTVPGFVYGIVKKYGDDEAGYQAALLTYYGFLSLFPLLLVATTVVDLLASTHANLRPTVTNSINSYFPALGQQLSGHIGSLHKTGLALAIGLLGTFYGARGVADAFRHGMNHIWHIPKEKRLGFPKSQLRSIAIIVIGGIGFILAATLASFATTAGHGWEFKLLSLLINLAIMFCLFIFFIKMGLPVPIRVAQIWIGAAVAAVGFVLVQALGGYILTHQMRNLSSLYSSFAVVLGLLFWIYLQSQVFFYAMEVTTVHDERLWPRSLAGQDLTKADKSIYARQAQEERMVPGEQINVEV